MPASVRDRFTVDFDKLYFFTRNTKYHFEQQFEDYKLESVKRERRGHNGGKWGVDNPLPAGVHTPTMCKKRTFKGYDGVEEEYESRKGRNKRCVWDITPKAYKEAHFAVFPPELVETPIKAGCPEFICNKCGKAREMIIEMQRPANYNPSVIDKEYQDNARKAGGGKGTNRPLSKIFQDSLNSKRIDKGLTDCGCNAGFHSGIVLDPFFGSGTTGEVAIRLGRNFIGIELNEKYIPMAEKRLNKVGLFLTTNGEMK